MIRNPPPAPDEPIISDPIPRASRGIRFDTNNWTLPAYIEHIEFMRRSAVEFGDERDRRYREVNIEKEKALKIKETADLAALTLARENQSLKDEKTALVLANSERNAGSYATHNEVQSLSEKFDVAHAPVLSFIAGAQGRSSGANWLMGWIFGGIGLIVASVSIIVQFSH